jgi:hypothetical protein
MSHQISRSLGLSSVPERKILEALEENLRNCTICSTKPGVKLDSNLCKNCRINNTRIKRYADANIPVIYWNLEMDHHFTGYEPLKEKYFEIVKDLRSSYRNGIAICFAGPHGRGKQLSLDTELPIPDGFIKLAELKEGDKLFDEQGNICNVLQLHPISYSPEAYEIEFDDGTKVEACADHLWSTLDRNTRNSKNKLKSKIRTTKEIFQTVRVEGKQRIANHSIPCSKPINYPKKNLLIDPYTLGCWLGDGTTLDGTIECADQEILGEINKAGYSINLIKNSSKKSKSSKSGLLLYQLNQLNLLKNKHIPNQYLYSSYEQRLALLQGLMDTNGCCAKDGRMEFCSVLPDLTNQVLQLIRSMGIKANINCNESWLYDKRHKDRYRISFTTKTPSFLG